MRVLLSALVAAQLFMVQAPIPTVAAEIPQDATINAVVLGDASIQAEQFKWFYRTYHGREQKRLWSLTEERWVTDWIYC